MLIRNKKVLVISYNFPPMGGGGVIRIAKFCKYLPAYNWEPIALTVKDYDIPLHDETLLDELIGTRIYRTRALDLALYYNRKLFENQEKKKDNYIKKSRIRLTTSKLIKKGIHNFIFIPDSRIGWLPFAVKKGIQICKSEGIDIIFSTGGPWTNHIIGLMLKVFTKRPWIADFRDPWTKNILFPYAFRLKKNIEEKMEKAVVSKADKIVGATDSIINDLKAKYYRNSGDKFYTITNGYDKEDYETISANICSNKGKFTIVYTGNFYSLQSPKYFLKALSLLLKDKPEIKNNFEVIFAGHWENWDKNYIKKIDLIDVIKYIGFISRPKVVELLSKCSVTLLIIAKEGTNIYTGKIFEYIAAGKPILALTPKNGIVADLIKTTTSGVVVDPENINEIKEVIFKLYRKFERKKLINDPNLLAIKKYDRKMLTENLSNLFNQTIKE